MKPRRPPRTKADRIAPALAAARLRRKPAPRVPEYSDEIDHGCVLARLRMFKAIEGVRA